MDPFLDPETNKTAQIFDKGYNAQKQKHWAKATLRLPCGKEAECFLNTPAGEENFEFDLIYKVNKVIELQTERLDDFKYRAFVYHLGLQPPQERVGNPRYRLSRKNQRFIKGYAKMCGLKTEGHWTTEAVDHLIDDLRKSEAFPALNDLPLEQ